MVVAMLASIPTMFCNIMPNPAGSDTFPFPAQKKTKATPARTASKLAATLFSDIGLANTVDIALFVSRNTI